MRIAHIVCTFPPYYGGMGNVVFNLASELINQGDEVVVYTPDYLRANEVKDSNAAPELEHQESLNNNLNFVKRLKPTLQYGNAAYLPQIARELDQFDIVHLHYPFFGVANLVRKWKLRNPQKKLVITYHMDTRGFGWKGLFFKYYSYFWLPKILKAADLLIATSLDYLQVSAASSSYQNNPGKWVELPLGVDLTRFQPGNKNLELMAKNGLNAELPTILFVGGMDQAHYFKGVPVLLTALYLLKKNNYSLQVVLVGKGELQQEFKSLAKNLGLADLVHFADSVSDEELPSYYNLADLLVLPSTTAGEAFGLVLLEAFASGVPVIASDLPGVRQVAKMAGTTVSPNDPQQLAAAILDFFALTEAERTNLSIVARQVAQDSFSWTSLTQKLREFYQQLVVKS